MVLRAAWLPGCLAERREMPADVGGRALREWCREHLGALVAERVFTAGHLSAVHGLRLADGREVVLKVAWLGTSRPRRPAALTLPANLPRPPRVNHDDVTSSCT